MGVRIRVRVRDGTAPGVIGLAATTVIPVIPACAAITGISLGPYIGLPLPVPLTVATVAVTTITIVPQIHLPLLQPLVDQPLLPGLLSPPQGQHHPQVQGQRGLVLPVTRGHCQWDWGILGRGVRDRVGPTPRAESAAGSSHQAQGAAAAGAQGPPPIGLLTRVGNSGGLVRGTASEGE